MAESAHVALTRVFASKLGPNDCFSADAIIAADDDTKLLGYTLGYISDADDFFYFSQYYTSRHSTPGSLRWHAHDGAPVLRRCADLMLRLEPGIPTEKPCF